MEEDDVKFPPPEDGKRYVDFKSIGAHSHTTQRCYIPDVSEDMNKIMLDVVYKEGKFKDREILIGYLIGKIEALEDKNKQLIEYMKHRQMW